MKKSPKLQKGIQAESLGDPSPMAMPPQGGTLCKRSAAYGRGSLPGGLLRNLRNLRSLRILRRTQEAASSTQVPRDGICITVCKRSAAYGKSIFPLTKALQDR